MRYEEFPPPASLAGYVACAWSFELEPGDPASLQHAIVPDGAVSILTVTAPGPPLVFLVGPRMTALRVTVFQGVRYLGMRLRPGAAAACLGASGRELRDYSGPLAAVAPRLAQDMLDRVRTCRSLNEAASAFESIVHPEPARADRAVLDAAVQIAERDGGVRVEELAAACNLSPRQLLRRFRVAVGLTPKEYARLCRRRAACIAAAVQGRQWAEVSAAAGYSDQAHLAREFAAIFDWPPSMVHTYLRRIEHVRFVQDSPRVTAAQ